MSNNHIVSLGSQVRELQEATNETEIQQKLLGIRCLQVCMRHIHLDVCMRVCALPQQLLQTCQKHY